MSREYPNVQRQKIREPHNRRCACCMASAVWAVTIQVSWFRGEDEVEPACDKHVAQAKAMPDEFLSAVALHKKYMSTPISAQHEETGRMWKGLRRDLPRRYIELP